MKLISIVGKEAYLAASIYDLIHVPYSPIRSIPHVFYAASLGPLLHVSYRVERSGLWSRLFAKLTGIASTPDGEVDIIINELKAINVYKWSEVEEMLADISERVSNLYQKIKDKIIACIGRVFRFKEFFSKLYVIYGFNPLSSVSLGSMLYFDRENVAVAVHVNDIHKESHVLDLIIHELLHGLIRLNDIKLEPDVEELVIDISAPDGYLSRMIGLVDNVNIGLQSILYFRKSAEGCRSLFSILKEYYERRIYNEASIIEWVQMHHPKA